MFLFIVIPVIYLIRSLLAAVTFQWTAAKLCVILKVSYQTYYVCSALKIGVESLYVHVMCFESYNGKCVCVSKKGISS